MSSSEFLSDYWQSQPLLIRQALNLFKTSLTAETLAGLSLEESIRSRLVLSGDYHDSWQCRFGPFEETDFTTLPATGWTLLVQDVEKHLPEYATLLDYFSFLPRWRVDDLMVSYAVNGGSVGPHTDQYDVFLLQAKGQRQWQIQTDNIVDDSLLEDTALKILKNFEAQQEWILEPGDMLYLPAGIAHHGIAIGDCMTFSIGFRAPTQTELLQTFADQVSNCEDSTQQFTDQTTLSRQRRGELAQYSLQYFYKMMRQTMENEQLMTQTIATLLTEPVDTPALFQTEEISIHTLRDKFAMAHAIRLHPATRSLYVQQEHKVQCYIDAIAYEINSGSAESLMSLVDNYQLEKTQIETVLGDDDLLSILFKLYQQGSLEIVL